MKRVGQVAALLAALAVGVGIGMLVQSVQEPDLIGLGASVLFSGGMETEYRAWEATDAALLAQLEDSRKRMRQHQRTAQAALHRIQELEDAALTLEQAAVGTALTLEETAEVASTPPADPACGPLFNAVRVLRADLESEHELRLHRETQLESYRSVLSVRDLEMAELVKQVELQRQRADVAGETLAKVRRRSRTVKLAGAAVLGVGVWLATR